MKDSIKTDSLYQNQKHKLTTEIQPSTIDNTIKIINAVGNQWKLLVILLLTGFYIANRKLIKGFLEKSKNFKAEVIGQKFEINTSEVIETDNSEKNIDKISAKSIEAKTEKVEAQIENKPSTLFDIWIEFDKQDINKGNKIYEELQSKEKDNYRRVENQIKFHYIQYAHGITSALSTLTKFTEGIVDDELKSFGHYYIGKCYQDSKLYAESTTSFLKSISLTQKEESKVDSVIRISKNHYNNEDKTNSLEILKKYLNLIKNQEVRVALYIEIAEYYSSEKNDLYKAIALEQALEITPNDTDLLFKIAYSYSSAGNEELSIFYYNQMLSLAPKSGAALNNIGVSYERLKLKMNARLKFKESFKNENTLAAGNLASQYISAGFREEAEKILDEAKLKKEVDDKVWAAIEDLKKDIKDEEDKKNHFQKVANKQQNLFRKYRGFLFNEDGIAPQIDGLWKITELSIEVTIIQKETTFILEWSEGNDKVKISGLLLGLISQITYKKTKSNIYMPDENYEGHIFINKNNDELDILVSDDKKIRSLRLIKNK